MVHKGFCRTLKCLTQIPVKEIDISQHSDDELFRKLARVVGSMGSQWLRHSCVHLDFAYEKVPLSKPFKIKQHNLGMEVKWHLDFSGQENFSQNSSTVFVPGLVF